MVFPLQYSMCCLSLCQICNSFIYIERRREANSSIQALSLSGARITHALLTVCAIPNTAQRHTEKSTTTTNWLFSSLSLSWLVPILFSATSEAWGNQHITEKAQPLVTSIIPLCCVVPDTVNNNQWTNNNLAGLIMRTMLTQQLVIHWSICQYCTAEQRVVLSSWKRNNSVYYNLASFRTPNLYREKKISQFFNRLKKHDAVFWKSKNFLDPNLYPTDTYPPSFQIKKIRYRVYPFPQIMHIKKITSCLPIIK